MKVVIEGQTSSDAKRNENTKRCFDRAKSAKHIDPYWVLQEAHDIIFRIDRSLIFRVPNFCFFTKHLKLQLPLFVSLKLKSFKGWFGHS